MTDSNSQEVDQKDWSGFVSVMLAAATLGVVGVAKLVSIDLAGGFAALFLVVWALYFGHPRVKVVEQ